MTISHDTSSYGSQALFFVALFLNIQCPWLPLIACPTEGRKLSWPDHAVGNQLAQLAAPKIWNSLPPALRMCTSHDTFRHQLMTHYFQLAFQPTYCLFSCASDSALADHCARLQIIFTYLLTYLLQLDERALCSNRLCDADGTRTRLGGPRNQ